VRDVSDRRRGRGVLAIMVVMSGEVERKELGGGTERLGSARGGAAAFARDEDDADAAETNDSEVSRRRSAGAGGGGSELGGRGVMRDLCSAFLERLACI